LTEVVGERHMEKMEAGVKGLYIREITLKYDYIAHRITAL